MDVSSPLYPGLKIPLGLPDKPQKQTGQFSPKDAEEKRQKEDQKKKKSRLQTLYNQSIPPTVDKK